ncbi:hypothetical protein [Buchnera aphidicola]|uniref:hypothetical protein n=1 Tax=Buchnera aphidicola TaxID=9 RepID=UPI003463ACD2
MITIYDLNFKLFIALCIEKMDAFKIFKKSTAIELFHLMFYTYTLSFVSFNKINLSLLDTFYNF